MSRAPILRDEALSPEQRRIRDSISPERTGFAEGPLRVWLLSPQLADRAQALGAFCRSGTSLPLRLSELAILVALLLPTAFALVLGLQIVGISGPAFAMLTLAVGQTFFEIALKARGLTNGDDGFSFEMPKTVFGLDASSFQHPETMFVVCWIALVANIALIKAGTISASRSLDPTRLGMKAPAPATIRASKAQ